MDFALMVCKSIHFDAGGERLPYENERHFKQKFIISSQ